MKTFIPQNELGVISLFWSLSEKYGWHLVETSQAFPDAIIEYQEFTWRVEYEFLASNFRNHKHNPDECDLIVCWVNDWFESPLPVLELSNIEESLYVLTQNRAMLLSQIQTQAKIIRALREELRQSRDKFISLEPKITGKSLMGETTIEQAQEAYEKCGSISSACRYLWGNRAPSKRQELRRLLNLGNNIS